VQRGRELSRLYDAGPQSGGRRPAPGRLALVQAFANSFYELEEHTGVDLFATRDALADWLEARGLNPGVVTAADHRRTLDVREGLRSLLREHNGESHDRAALLSLREASVGLPVAIGVDDDGGTEPIVAGPGVDAALGLIVAVVHEARVDGTWDRLKACPGRHCGWAFYDQSVNRTSTWCSMRVCGGREKARAYRQRARTRRACSQHPV
jgi:predicted RNA-binding Zn ribbon-like protein